MTQLQIFIGCDQCKRQFGGPNGGEYDWREYPGGMAGVESMLIAEAIDLGWARLEWYNFSPLLCSPGCVADWMNDQLEGKHDGCPAP